MNEETYDNDYYDYCVIRARNILREAGISFINETDADDDLSELSFIKHANAYVKKKFAQKAWNALNPHIRLGALPRLYFY